jgi:multicomponent Na+:H+ antiporter subunit G
VTELLASILMLASGVLTLAAGIGVLRLPNLLTRLHASTKAGGGAFLLIMLVLVIRIPEPAVMAKAVLASLLALISLPLAAQALARHSRRIRKRDNHGT